jgi:hypothetical protein
MGMIKDTCIPHNHVAAQSLQSLVLRILQIERSLRITNSHAKKPHNKIRNISPIASNRNKSYPKLIYSSRRTHGYKER